MTCNNTDGLDENLFDRCYRIRYYRKYKANANEIFIKEMIEDKGLTPNQPLVDFIKRFTVKSFDNINSFLDEYKLYLETTDTNFMLEDVANIMNISLEDELEKNDSKNNIENDLILNDIDV